MAIGTPVFLGSVRGSGVPLTLTTGAASPAGNRIVIAAFFANTLGDPSAATDSGGNTYTASSTDTSGGNYLKRFFVADTTNLVASGGTISVTFAFGLAASAVFAWSVPPTLAGGIDSNVNMKQTNNTGGSVGFSTTSATLGSSSEILFGLAVIYGAGAEADAFTPDASWSGAQSNVTVAGFALRAAYKIVSSNAAVTWAPTMGTSRQWETVMLAIKEGGSSGGSGTMSMMGV